MGQIDRNARIWENRRWDGKSLEYRFILFCIRLFVCEYIVTVWRSAVLRFGYITICRDGTKLSSRLFVFVNDLHCNMYPMCSRTSLFGNSL